ncbi:DgyrCDS14515 [Dimorphilus gyrociliatus]|uniref:DgyrCDS14515 n=1 Tax=Dimorphilus gyrociliatus TaxID=2664684 RepID=A0A7I8WE89_9ANNE|nr:DgyrCDS14515 [Dimorphilus gyrociliatus]
MRVFNKEIEQNTIGNFVHVDQLYFLEDYNDDTLWRNAEKLSNDGNVPYLYFAFGSDYNVAVKTSAILERNYHVLWFKNDRESSSIIDELCENKDYLVTIGDDIGNTLTKYIIRVIPWSRITFKNRSNNFVVDCRRFDCNSDNILKDNFCPELIILLNNEFKNEITDDAKSELIDNLRKHTVLLLTDILTEELKDYGIELVRTIYNKYTSNHSAIVGGHVQMRKIIFTLDAEEFYHSTDIRWMNRSENSDDNHIYLYFDKILINDIIGRLVNLFVENKRLPPVVTFRDNCNIPIKVIETIERESYFLDFKVDSKFKTYIYRLFFLENSFNFQDNEDNETKKVYYEIAHKKSILRYAFRQLINKNQLPFTDSFVLSFLCNTDTTLDFMAETAQTIKENIKETLTLFNPCILTNGLNHGLSEYIGNLIDQMCCIGIVYKSENSQTGYITTNEIEDVKPHLNPKHNCFLFVKASIHEELEENGIDTFITKGNSRECVSLILGGDFNTLKEIVKRIQSKTRVVVIANSGHLAEYISIRQENRREDNNNFYKGLSKSEKTDCDKYIEFILKSEWLKVVRLEKKDDLKNALQSFVYNGKIKFDDGCEGSYHKLKGNSDILRVCKQLFAEQSLRNTNLLITFNNSWENDDLSREFLYNFEEAFYIVLKDYSPLILTDGLPSGITNIVVKTLKLIGEKRIECYGILPLSIGNDWNEPEVQLNFKNRRLCNYHRRFFASTDDKVRNIETKLQLCEQIRREYRQIKPTVLLSILFVIGGKLFDAITDVFTASLRREEHKIFIFKNSGKSSTFLVKFYERTKNLQEIYSRREEWIKELKGAGIEDSQLDTSWNNLVDIHKKLEDIYTINLISTTENELTLAINGINPSINEDREDSLEEALINDNVNHLKKLHNNDQTIIETIYVDDLLHSLYYEREKSEFLSEILRHFLQFLSTPNKDIITDSIKEEITNISRLFQDDSEILSLIDNYHSAKKEFSQLLSTIEDERSQKKKRKEKGSAYELKRFQPKGLLSKRCIDKLKRLLKVLLSPKCKEHYRSGIHIVVHNVKTILEINQNLYKCSFFKAFKLVAKQYNSDFDLYENSFLDWKCSKKRWIFLWAIVSDKAKVADYFWVKGESSIRYALFAVGILKCSLNTENDIVLSTEMSKRQDLWERRACGNLEHCYALNSSKGFEVSATKSKEWENKNMLQLARSVESLTFFENPLCQRYLNNKWKGRRIFLSARLKFTIYSSFYIFFVMLFSYFYLIDLKPLENGSLPLSEKITYAWFLYILIEEIIQV